VSNCVLKTGLKFHLNLHLNERRTLKVNDPIQAQSFRLATGIHSTILPGTKVQTRTCVFQTQTWAASHPLSTPLHMGNIKRVFSLFFALFNILLRMRMRMRLLPAVDYLWQLISWVRPRGFICIYALQLKQAVCHCHF